MMFAKERVRKSLLAKMVGELLDTRVMVKGSMKAVADDKVRCLCMRCEMSAPGTDDAYNARRHSPSCSTRASSRSNSSPT